MPLSINHQEQKSNLSMYSLAKGLLGKVHDSTTPVFFDFEIKSTVTNFGKKVTGLFDTLVVTATV